MKLFKKMRKGFTLIELVVVIAVIAILSAVAVVSYVTITNKAKQSNDQQKVDQLNLSLTAVEIGGKPSTMYKALDGLREEGFIPENFKAEARNYKFAYSMSKNRFVILDNNKVVYPKNISDLETWDIWKFASNEEELDSDYSHYLLKDFTSDGSISVNAGVDVGENAGVKSITYSNDANKNVVIRTNSANTTLTIDDESEGTIYHYGSAGALNIIQCHTGSYHENGNVAFAEIAKGRIVLESGSKIDHIHINKKDNNSFNNIIITNNGAEELPNAITRDQVEVTGEKTQVVVVESNNTSETIYVYPYTDSESTKTGTTEKTETQNATVTTELGLLVIDNSNYAGEKAMSNNDKEETKETVVDILASEEINEANESGANYVVRIGAKGYESFEKGFNAMVDGDTLTMVQNATLNKELVKGTAGNTATIGNYVIDLGGYTLTTTSDLTKLSYNDGGYDSVMDFYNINITLKNGTIDDSNNVPGSTICVLDNANAILENLSITFTAHSANYGCLLTDTNSGGTPTLLVKDCSLEIYGCGAQIAGNATATFENCDINQTMTYKSGKYSRNCIAASGGSNVIINGGNYTSNAFCLYVYNSGGGFVVNSGTFTGEYVVRMDNNQKSTGFNSQYNYGGRSVFTANGGTFTGKLSQSIANDGICEWIDNGGTFSSDNYSTYFTQNND